MNFPVLKNPEDPKSYIGAVVYLPEDWKYIPEVVRFKFIPGFYVISKVVFNDRVFIFDRLIYSRSQYNVGFSADKVISWIKECQKI